MAGYLNGDDQTYLFNFRMRIPTFKKLVEMVAQTRQIEEIIKNFRHWTELYKKLKKLQEQRASSTSSGAAW